MIYQHVNKRTAMLLLATSHIAINATSWIMLRCQLLCHILKALFFIKRALKRSYFCKKMQNFRALGAPPPDPRASGGLGLRPQTASPIANFWLRACSGVHLSVGVHLNLGKKCFIFGEDIFFGFTWIWGKKCSFLVKTFFFWSSLNFIEVHPPQCWK